MKSNKYPKTDPPPKLCPFCKSDDVKPEWFGGITKDAGWQMVCLACGVRGPRPDGNCVTPWDAMTRGAVWDTDVDSAPEETYLLVKVEDGCRSVAARTAFEDGRWKEEGGEWVFGVVAWMEVPE